VELDRADREDQPDNEIPSAIQQEQGARNCRQKGSNILSNGKRGDEGQ
jgi:hypothetical protein